MKHQHSDNGSTTQRSAAMFLLLLAVMLSSGTLLAQSPVYDHAMVLGGSGPDRPGSVVTDADGNIYVTGLFTGTVDFDPGSGSATLSGSSNTTTSFLASYDATGAYRWAFTMGTNSTAGGPEIKLDASGNIVIGGNFTGTADFNPGSGTANLTSVTLGSYFVARYSSAGNYLWAFKLDVNRESTLAVATDASDNVIVSGMFAGTVDFNPGSGSSTLKSERSRDGYPDIFVAKYSSSGGYLWAFRLGNSLGEFCNAIATDAGGNVYITGQFIGTVDFNPGSGTASLTAAGESNIFVAKYASAGGYSWAFRVGGTSTFYGAGRAMALDGNGNIVLVGTYHGTGDFDPGSGTANLTSSSGTNITERFIARYSSTGSYLWANARVGGNGLAVDSGGDIYVTGGFGGTVDFDPGPSTATLSGGGAYTARYNSSGAYQWVFKIDSSSGRSIAVDGNGDVTVTGEFNARSATDFDPGSGTASLSGSGRDLYIARYGQSTLPKRSAPGSDPADLVPMVAAPNPFTDAFSLSIGGGSTPMRVEIVDMSGTIVESIDEVAPGGEIRLGESLPAGTYLLRATQGEATRQTIVRKVR